MDKKYFFFDIDGTLTDRSNGKIVPSAVTALEKLRKAGHFVAINTGRAHYKARKFFDENGFDNMVCNGGMAIVVNRELVENSPINYEKALKLYTRHLIKATASSSRTRIRSVWRAGISGSTTRRGSAKSPRLI